jgi:hypothetical protein
MSIGRRLSCALALSLLAVCVFAAELPSAKPEAVGLSSQRLERIAQVLGAKVDAGEIRVMSLWSHGTAR